MNVIIREAIKGTRLQEVRVDSTGVYGVYTSQGYANLDEAYNRVFEVVDENGELLLRFQITDDKQVPVKPHEVNGMRKCPNCESIIYNGERFCSHCGKALIYKGV